MSPSYLASSEEDLIASCKTGEISFVNIHTHPSLNKPIFLHQRIQVRESLVFKTMISTLHCFAQNCNLVGCSGVCQHNNSGSR